MKFIQLFHNKNYGWGLIDRRENSLNHLVGERSTLK